MISSRQSVGGATSAHRLASSHKHKHSQPMSFLQWKRFQFFDKERISPLFPASDELSGLEPSGSGISSVSVSGTDSLNPSDERLRDMRITCASSGRGHIFLGDADGIVYLIDKQLKVTSFRAFESQLTHLIQIPQTTYLIVSGSDEPVTTNPLIRIFNLDKWTGHPDGRKPICTREIRCIAGSSQTNVTCIASSESLDYLAVGFSDGTLVIHKGDVTRERQSKQRMVKVSDCAVTGLVFGSVNNQLTSLFVATSRQVFSYLIRKERETQLVLDEKKGADFNRSCLITDAKRGEKLFVVGRNDAVYFYQADERGPCFAFDGEKEILVPFRNYLVVVSRDRTAASFARSSPTIDSESQIDLKAYGSDLLNPSSQLVGHFMITIYDLQNKFVAYTSAIPPAEAVVSEWGMLYVVTKDGRLFQLSEKDVNSKLEVLFRKNQFSLASELAQSYNYGPEQLAEIAKHFADHLYRNGDYDAAIVQYSKTIGVLEPSYVIRKFLDSSRIQNLTQYLKQLMAKKLCNEDHTTLLINCFAKLKDNKELEELTSQAQEFDVDTVIKVLRRARFYDHASRLAQDHNKYDTYMQIQLNERDDAASALNFLLQNVHERERLAMLIKYGRLLIAKEPERTTDLAKRFTCSYLQDSSSFNLSMMSDSGAIDPLSNSKSDFELSDILNIFVQNVTSMIEFIEHVIESHPSQAPTSFYTTILAIHLRSHKSCKESEKRQSLNQKIMGILVNEEANYDMDQAILLCAANSFDDGLTYLYRRSENYLLLIEHFARKKDAVNIVRCCQEYESSCARLWVEALWFFANNEPNSEQQVIVVLEAIERLHLLHPIEVIEILSRNEKLQLACIKDYAIRFLTKESAMIAENDRYILQYKDETERMKQAIEDMKTGPRIFQAAKCSWCNKALDLPSVHFYCGHSYHQSCFDSQSYSVEHDSECPICLPENTKLLNLIRMRKSVTDVSQKLREELARPESDVTSVVSSYLSKGVLSEENRKSE